MQSVMNLKTKFRESFRPFAPAVLAEHASEHFEIDREPVTCPRRARAQRQVCRARLAPIGLASTC